MPIPENLQAARFRLAYFRPYLSAAIWSLHVQESTTIPTLAVDKYWRMQYNPEFCAKLSAEEFAGVLYHEISHLLRDHPGRGQSLDPTMANIAGDLEINDDIEAEARWGGVTKFTLPGDCLLPKKFNFPDNLLMEEYYEMLEKEAKKNGGQPPAANGVGNGQCGGIANGDGDDSDAPSPGQPGLSQTEADLVRDKVAKDIKAESSSGRGDIPGSLQRWADDLLNPKVDWKKALKAAVRNAVSYVSGNFDFTYQRPSRRRDPNFVFPARHQPIPEIAIVIDTSGSIGGTQLDQALAEVQGVLKTVAGGRGAVVMSVDAALHTKQRVNKASQVELGGGGGTDMGVGIAAAERLKPRPNICIVLTDGYTPWPAEPPAGMRVIVATTAEAGPAWAETIKID